MKYGTEQRNRYGEIPEIRIADIEERIRNYRARKLDISGLRPSAVLIPIIRKRGSIIFIERTMTVKDHKGQIAFPGGVIDEEDNGDPIKTALREAEEEIGLPQNKVKVIGFLDDTITIAGYLIHPVVGVVEEDIEVKKNEEKWGGGEAQQGRKRRIKLKPNPSEVERIIIAPLSELMKAKYIEVESEPRWEFYLADGTKIWGATARILRNFLEVSGLREFQKVRNT